MRTISVLVLLMLAIASYGQSEKKKRKKQKAASERSQPTSLDPGVPQSGYEPKKSRKSSKGPTYNNEREYYERVEELEKTRRKNEKLSEKPQYSDPSYFGHKRPPKKRPANKMKYCKVCGIRH